MQRSSNGQTLGNLTFYSGHFGFGAPTEYAHRFKRGTQAKFFIQCSKMKNPLRLFVTVSKLYVQPRRPKHEKNHSASDHFVLKILLSD